jgi:hypothetical protein
MLEVAFPALEARIRDAEHQLGLDLPADLRARLMRDNGGEVLCDGEFWQVHPVWDDTDRRTMARTTSHILHETFEARKRAGFPMEAVAIASDGSGNLLVLRRGSALVERWDHETGDCSPVEVDWT